MPRHSGDSRGSSYDRRRQKNEILRRDGDGVTCLCVHCHRTLTFETLVRDRKIPGTQGGGYKLDNLQPSCKPCNDSRQDRLDWVGSAHLAPA